MMQWLTSIHPLIWTLVFIFLAAIIGAFIRGRIRDKCLKAFRGFRITYEDVAGIRVSGVLRLESTGFELIYPGGAAAPSEQTSPGDERSFILYKYEYGNIQILIRFHDALTEANRRQRDRELSRVYHPAWWRRAGRQSINAFKTIRDSVLDVSNVLLSHAKTATPAGAVLTAQDKYVNQMKNELIGSVDTAYEPLLERHIGQRVVAEVVRQDAQISLTGVLKDYTSEFIELLDVAWPDTDAAETRKADIILPRKRAVIRHAAE